MKNDVTHLYYGEAKYGRSTVGFLVFRDGSTPALIAAYTKKTVSRARQRLLESLKRKMDDLGLEQVKITCIGNTADHWITPDLQVEDLRLERSVIKLKGFTLVARSKTDFYTIEGWKKNLKTLDEAGLLGKMHNAVAQAEVRTPPILDGAEGIGDDILDPTEPLSALETDVEEALNATLVDIDADHVASSAPTFAPLPEMEEIGSLASLQHELEAEGMIEGAIEPKEEPKTEPEVRSQSDPEMANKLPDVVEINRILRAAAEAKRVAIEPSLVKKNSNVPSGALVFFCLIVSALTVMFFGGA